MSSNGLNGNKVSPNAEDFLNREKKAASKARLCKVFFLGLVPYVVCLCLYLAIAGHYLSMRDCHRGLSHNMKPFTLTDFVQLNSSIDDPGQDDEREPSLYERLKSLVDDRLYVRVRDDLIRLVPEHWVRKALSIVTFQVSRYRPSQLADFCAFNGRRFESAFEVGAYLCERALDNRQLEAVADAFAGVSAADEDAILAAALARNVSALVRLVPGALGLAVPAGAADLALKYLAVLEPDDLARLAAFVSDPDVAPKLPAMMEAMGRLDPADLENVGEAFGRIDPENFPKLEAAFGKLGISLSDFLVDPGSLLSFFSDPELSQVLFEIQGLLPTFPAKSVNSLLRIKNTFDEVEGAGDVLEKAMQLPMDLLLKLFTVKLTPEDREAMNGLSGLTDDPKIKSLMDLAKGLGVTGGPEAIQSLAEKCSHEELRIECADTSVDLCPTGHYQYGLLTLLPFIQPAILFAISEFKFFRAFRFGGLPGKLYGQGWNRLLRWAMLPLYALVMIPFFRVIVVVKYYRGLKKIFQQKSAAQIQNELDDALNLHALEITGNGFFQLFTQLQFLVLLVTYGGGTLISGVDAHTIFNAIVPLAATSLVLTSLSYVHTMWRVKQLDHRTKGLPEPSSRRWLSLGTFLVWIVTAEATQVLSILGLIMLAWLEIFSGTLGPSGLNVVSVHVIPAVVLQLLFGINVWLRKRYVPEEEPVHFAVSVLSAVFPMKFLHRTDRANPRKLLLIGQMALWACHVGAWLAYAIIVYAQHGEAAGILRMVPVVSALVALGPLLGAAHWSLGVNPAYDETRLKRKESKEVELPGLQRPWCFRLWQAFTVATRLASLALLFFVYHEHLSEVPAGLAWLFQGPYLVLLVVASAGLQLGILGRWASAGSVLSAWLLPNRFRRARPGRAGKYLVLNVGLNLVLHLLLWLSLTFYCWACSRAFDPHFAKLRLGFPIAVGLWMVALVFTLITWRISIRHSLGNFSGSSATSDAYHVPPATAWTDKEAAVTTKF